jgi:hypothetical protein
MFMGSFPFQATQLDVDAGTITDQFVSPNTLFNSSKWGTKQDTLISGTNIKTINSNSLLGSGDIVISGGTWGSITGTLSTQTDLQTALNLKANLSGAGFTGPVSVTSASATSFSVGRLGSTTPVLNIDSSTALQIGGVSILGGVTGGTTSITATDSGANHTLRLASKGNGGVVVASVGGSVFLQAFASTRYTVNNHQHVFTSGTSSNGSDVRFGYTGSADTNLTTTVEAPSVLFNLAQTRQHATGAITLQRDFRIAPSTHSFVGASTITNAAGFSVDNAPVAGANATITRSSTIFSNGAAVGSGVVDSYGLNVSANTGATRNWAARFPGQLVFASATPTIAAGVGAGTTPTISIAGTVEGGVITLTTGTLPTLSAVVATVTNANAFPTGSSVVITPANANAALLSGTSMVFTVGSTSSWTLNSGSVALTDATSYLWNYIVIGY